MCLLILAHHVSRQYPLLVAANRDEFHRRPTTPSRFWPEQPSLLAGRDEQLGGTWMGLTRAGKFAAVTNFRDPAATVDAPRSRGELPLDYLLGQRRPEAYLQAVRQRAGEYAGFNLLLGDGDTLWYFSNNPQQTGQEPGAPRELAPGIYGLSNARLDTPWPKVVTGKQRLEKMILAADSVGHDSLLALVNSTDLADPDTLTAMGMESAMEHLLSAQFIRSETYGTRSSTTLWYDREVWISWRELRFDAGGLVQGTQLENFRRI